MDIGLDPNGHQAGLTGPASFYTWTTSKAACKRSLMLAHSYYKRPRTWAAAG